MRMFLRRLVPRYLHPLILCVVLIGKNCAEAGSSFRETPGAEANSVCPSAKINYRFDHIAENYGLCDPHVFSVFQDSYGFMWFGTGSGLSKYDGNRCKSYLINAGTPMLSGETVFAMHEDSSGNLWVGTTTGGLYRYIREMDLFKQYLQDPRSSKSLGNNSVFSLYMDRDSTLWVGCAEGVLNKYIQKTDSFEQIDLLRGRPQHSWNYITAITEDLNGNLWLGTNETGLVRLHKESGEMTWFQYDVSNDQSISGNSVWSLLVDADGELWVGTKHNGLNHFNSAQGGFDRFLHDSENENSLSNNSVLSIIEDASGILWIGTEHGGLNRFDKRNKVFMSYQADDRDPHSICDNTIWQVFEDHAGVIWLATENSGLSKFDYKKRGVHSFHSHSDRADFMSHKSVWSLLEDVNGDLWIGTFRGLNRFDREKDRFISYLHDPEDSNSLSMDQIQSLMEDSRGNLWVGTAFGGLNLYNRAGDNFTHYPFDTLNAQGIDGSRVDAMIEIADSVYLLGTDAGLVQFNPFTGVIKRYREEIIVRSMYRDDKNGIWVGSQGCGLFHSVEGEMTFSEVFDDPELRNQSVFSIVESAANPAELLFGLSNGLLILDRQTGNLRHVSRKSSNVKFDYVASAFDDQRGNIWMAANKGLYVIDRKSWAIRELGPDDGVENMQFNARAGFRNKQGKIYFGGVDGFTEFHPDSIIENHVPPQLMLTGLKINNQTVAIGPQSPLRENINICEKIILHHNQRNIQLEFSALHYSHPPTNQYKYRLFPFEQAWHQGNNRTATYTNLDPGNYTFQFSGSNNDGVWATEAGTLFIQVLPPWWRTIWAYLIYLTITISVARLLYQLRISRLRLQHQVEMEHLAAERLQETDKLKSKFFANISHEFRTPLTLILGFVHKLLAVQRDKDQTQDLNMIGKQAKRLLELVTQMLDLARLENNTLTLKAKQRNVVPLIGALVHSFSSLADLKDIHLSCHTECEEIEVFTDKGVLLKIINNLLSNALKFTPAGGQVEVIISFAAHSPLSDQGALRIDVIDSGPGIPPDQLERVFDRFYRLEDNESAQVEGTGIGLSLVKELVELHHGSVEIESQNCEGTAVSVHLPLGSDHLEAGEIVEEDSDPDGDAWIANDARPEELSIQIPQSRGSAASRLLIVEDNSDVRALIRSYLDREYRCYEAADGIEALKLIQQFHPDLVISDVMMPRMDGNLLCKKIKNDEQTSHIPIILLTAKADKESKLEGLGTGADDYLTKPFEAEELQLRVHNLIQQRQNLRQKIQKEIGLLPEELDLQSIDKKFISRVLDVVSRGMSEPDFSVAKLSKQVHMSRQHLNRKLRSITGLTTVEFIRSQRLKRAALLLRNKQSTITEIAYAVGFSTPSHFSRAFQREFGQTPSAYLNEFQPSN